MTSLRQARGFRARALERARKLLGRGGKIAGHGRAFWLRRARFWRRYIRRRVLWRTVAFDGCPMFRAQALALQDARDHGVRFRIISGDRRPGVAERFGKSSQAALYRHWRNRDPGYLPANPPGQSSHELRSDGNRVYGPRFGTIPKYELGLDAGTNEQASRVVAWLGAHGYHAAQPYPTGSELHHFSLTRDPTDNLVKRGLIK